MPHLDANVCFLLASRDGYIKQVPLAQLQPTRTYRSRAITAMKLKSADDIVLRVDLLAADAATDIILFTSHAYAVRFATAEVPELGAKAAGVKSVNLKAGDTVVAYVLIQPEAASDYHIGIMTQRGAFKQIKAEIIHAVSRAKRGVMVLRELKTKPHRIAAVTAYLQNHQLLITTSSARQVTVATNAYPVGDRYSNGSFVMDPELDGTPVTMTLGRPLSDERVDATRLF